MTDRSFAINALRNYYMPHSLAPSLTALIAGIEAQASPGFLELWGRGVRALPQNNLAAPLARLAQSTGMRFPSQADLNSALVDAASTQVSTIGRDLSSGIVKASETIKEGVPWVLGGGVLIAVGALALFIFLNSPRGARAA